MTAIFSLGFAFTSLNAESTVKPRVQEINKDYNTAPVGLLSQALRVKNKTDMIYVSGQIPLDPATKMIIEGDITTLTNQVIDQIEILLKAGGSDLQHVVRVEIFLTDLANISVVNQIYSQRFQNETMPVRQTIQVAALPFGSPIEISCIAYVPDAPKAAKVEKPSKVKKDKKDKKDQKKNESNSDSSATPEMAN